MTRLSLCLALLVGLQGCFFLFPIPGRELAAEMNKPAHLKTPSAHADTTR